MWEKGELEGQPPPNHLTHTPSLNTPFLGVMRLFALSRYGYTSPDQCRRRYQCRRGEAFACHHVYQCDRI